VLARGGGDATALLAWSDETLCRAVAACPVPVVSAIGHEADRPVRRDRRLRCGTPSIAAHTVVPDRRALSTHLDQLAARRRAALRSAWTRPGCAPGASTRGCAGRRGPSRHAPPRGGRASPGGRPSPASVGPLRRPPGRLGLAPAHRGTSGGGRRRLGAEGRHLRPCRRPGSWSAGTPWCGTVGSGTAKLGQVDMGDELDIRLAAGSLKARVTAAGEPEGAGPMAEQGPRRHP